jgi:hypothetical protein
MDHEADLLAYAAEALARVPGLRMIGTAPAKIGGHSFILAGVHAHDVATVLDGEGIAVRAGHHCAQPILRRFGVAATVRASFALYNTRDDIDRLITGLGAVRALFAHDRGHRFYRALVLEHGKHPRNVGRLATATHAADGDNPLCGDVVRVEAEVVGDGVVALRFSGELRAGDGVGVAHDGAGGRDA